MTISCSIPECEDTSCARTWCNKHYRRWLKTGDPLGSKQREPRELKTHCKHGHPMSGDNLRLRAVGNRICRVCKACSKESVYRVRAKRRATRGIA